MDGPRVFVTSVGTGDYTAVTYTYRDREERSAFAPVATARLLDLAGSDALVLLTGKAKRKHWMTLAEALESASLRPTPVEIGEGRTEEEILAIFSTLVERVPEQASVVLDVTYALRHLPFVYLASLAYLEGLRAVELTGVYYGAFELRDGDRVPVIQLSPLLDLLHWYQGLACLRQTGDPSPMGDVLRANVATLFRRGQGNPALGRAAAAVRDLARGLTGGLPLETGIHARRLLKVLDDLEPETQAPAARNGLEHLRQIVSPLAFAHPVQTKDAVTLDEQELERQLCLAKWYAEHGDEPKALLVLREFLVSLAIYRWHGGQNWLDFLSTRDLVSSQLNAFETRARYQVATEGERRIASLWRGIADRRNLYAHAGMRKGDIAPSPERILDLIRRCRELLSGEDFPEACPSDPQTLLVTPLGRSPGVLFSAVRAARPAGLLVVTSSDAQVTMTEALERAEYRGAEPQTVVLRDPFSGYASAVRDAEKGLARDAVQYGRVVVNVTGGTTAMQIAVEQLAAQVRRLGVPLRRIALIDRREPEAQRADPWVEAEVVELDTADSGVPP